MKRTVFEIQMKHVVLLFAIIAFIAMTFMVPTNAEYISIVLQRNSLAKTVSEGSCNLDSFEEDYQVCQERLDNMRDESRYGQFLAEKDGAFLGKAAIVVVMLAQVVVMIFAILLVWAAFVVSVEKAIKRVMRKLYRIANIQVRKQQRKAKRKAVRHAHNR